MSASPANELARILYETMEKLTPGVEDYIEWPDLDELQRSLYAHAVTRLLAERDLIGCALALADHNAVDG
jgi:hypothetical protein